jgi:SEL1 protein
VTTCNDNNNNNFTAGQLFLAARIRAFPWWLGETHILDTVTKLPLILIMTTGVSTGKLVLLSLLGIAAALLGGAVLSLRLKVIHLTLQTGMKYSSLEERLVPVQNADGYENDQEYDRNDSPEPTFRRDEMHVSYKSTTIKASVPTASWDIKLWSTFPAPKGSSVKTSGEAFWRQVVAHLREWDVHLWPADPTDYHASLTAWQVRHPSDYYETVNRTRKISPYPRLALEMAAHAGHPMAQHYLAMAHASGIWPVPASPSEQSSNSHAEPLTEDLHVFEEWIPSAHGDHPQVTKSFLLWQMAAMAGNVEAAMALAYRFDHSLDDQRDSQTTCEDALPYYQAAADGIMDQLETSLQSRAKVVPPMDKHVLAQVHMHGGTSSQLDWNNKPDESKEALQFYHLKATTVPWSMKKSSSGKSKKAAKAAKREKRRRSEEDSEGIDVSAAYTLGHLYHHGLRGVEQNLTKSLEYYEIAGLNGHWESSGYACLFHLWGMGVQQDVHEALMYCRLGAPIGLDECRNRHRYITARSHKKDEEVDRTECDSNALNGLGLLHLMGVPGSIDVNMKAAEQYFALAKELGNADAHYNLAMMWLGWKTHYKTLDELEEGGVSNADPVSTNFPLHDGNDKRSSAERFALHMSKMGNDDTVFKGPNQEDVQNAMKLLAFASTKGHVQAKHRLGMIYAEGIRLQTSVLKYESVKKDCKKAKAMFQWVVENASPARSKRLKKAYQEYIGGNLDVSLRNYLAAAETGSNIAQVNAAFLLERGVCLGLGPADCAKASVRLWKAAAARGNAEACLRVGDFYYYGRLRGKKLPVGPFAWVQYLLYPERYLPVLLDGWSNIFMGVLKHYLAEERDEHDGTSLSTCSVDAEDGICSIESEVIEENHDDNLTESDLQMAAHYYQVAVEKHKSARANFNLGFMHQFGLGLKQDFPLAKRHYDLAVSGNAREAELAVQLALMAMNLHESIIRWKVVVEDWWYERSSPGVASSETDASIRPPKSLNNIAGQPVPGQSSVRRRTREEIIMSHLLDWSSFVIVGLVIIVIRILFILRGRQGRT